ncbi:MAG TPA: N-acetyltransferase [Cytophagaceae bacterium]
MMSWIKQTELIIREEKPEDIPHVSNLINLSFKNSATGTLVNMLRERKDFIYPLSLVAEINETIIGYILLSPIKIQTADQEIKTLWLEPVCVHPKYQKKGIGSALIKHALEISKKMEYESVFVNGSPDYYPRFGFKQASEFGIEPSIAVSPEVFLALELKKNTLTHKGILIYPEEIFD